MKDILFSLAIIIGLIQLGCVKKSDFILDPFFQELEKESPSAILKEFKATELDSVVLNHKSYSAIYVDAAAKVMEETPYATDFDKYLEKYGMVMQQDLLVTIAAFHKWLNHQPIEIDKLKIEITDLLNNYHESIHEGK